MSRSPDLDCTVATGVCGSACAGVPGISPPTSSEACLYYLMASPKPLASSGSFFGPNRIKTIASMSAMRALEIRERFLM
jgi:hypothetical protein